MSLFEHAVLKMCSMKEYTIPSFNRIYVDSGIIQSARFDHFMSENLHTAAVQDCVAVSELQQSCSGY